MKQLTHLAAYNCACLCKTNKTQTNKKPNQHSFSFSTESSALYKITPVFKKTIYKKLYLLETETQASFSLQFSRMCLSWNNSHYFGQRNVSLPLDAVPRAAQSNQITVGETSAQHTTLPTFLPCYHQHAVTCFNTHLNS